jgi:hypothetical protein
LLHVVDAVRDSRTFSPLSYLPMATLQAVKKAVTLPPTVRVLASGVPSAPLVNLASKAPADHHGEHGAVGPRASKMPTWAHNVSGGLYSKSYVTGELFVPRSTRVAGIENAPSF